MDQMRQGQSKELRRDYPHPFAGTGSNMRGFASGPEPIDDT
jgi:hypothetical protein